MTNRYKEICDICGKKFFGKEWLRRHKEAHNPPMIRYDRDPWLKKWLEEIKRNNR